MAEDVWLTKAKTSDDDGQEERSHKNSPLRYVILGILAVVVLVLGGMLIFNKKKEATAEQELANSETEKTTATSNKSQNNEATPTYLIRIREDQAGDKSIVTEKSSGTFTTSHMTPQGKQIGTKQTNEKIEYKLEIIEFPNGADRPTKFIREYKVQEEETNGARKSFSYVGKLVSFEKKGDRYTITCEGKPLPEEEDKSFNSILLKPDLKNSEMVPKTPVKINEIWTINHEVMDKLANLLGGYPINKSKSKATGKLTRVYSNGGKQCGAIVFQFDLVVEGTSQGLPVSGTVTCMINVDTSIDGSSSEDAMKAKLHSKVEIQDKDNPNTLILDGDEETTSRPIK